MSRPSHHAVRLFLTLLLVVPVFAAAPTGYYDSASGLSGAALQQALHDIIDDHTRYPYTSSSTDTWDILHAADEDEANPDNVRDLYRNRSFVKEDHWSSSNTSGWNREHSWPKSYGFSQDGTCNYPYTDTHHLFASDGGYNSARSNIPYDWAPGGTAYPVDELGFSNWKLGSYSEGSWEVWEYRKGDVARAAFYMAVRYEGGLHGATGCSEPDLRLTNDRSLIVSDSSNNQAVAYMGILSTLLQWHIEDPVDDRERRRNDVVYGYQGNRNPFVDHPEWVCEIFPCSTGGTNQVPLANFSAECNGLDCSFTDLSTDSDGTIASWSWNFGDGGSSGVTNPTHTFAADGSYEVTLSVTDDLGDSDSVTQTVTVSAGGSSGGGFDLSGWKLTQANYAYEYTFPAGTTVSDDGYLIIARSATRSAFESFWGVSLGSSAFIDSGNGMPVINGDEVYALYDASGALVDGTTIAISSGGNVQRTDLCGSASSPASWSVSSTTAATPGGGAGAGCGAGIRISEFSDASGTGNYIYEFVELHFDTATSGGNEPPVAWFDFGCTDLDCGFTDASSDDGTIVAWAWSFGDGGSATTANPSHSYASAGAFDVTLTVTDDGGLSHTVTRRVDVTAPAAGITLTAGGYKVKGVQHADLSWSGHSGSVTIYRNGTAIATVSGSSYADNIGNKGGGSYTYQVCDGGGCSNTEQVSF